MKMINSLFSSFDPIGSFFISNYLILVFICLFPCCLGAYIIKNRITFLISNILYMPIERELSASINNSNKKGKFNILLAIFIFILITNILGLTPYVFTISAQIIITLRLALPFWLGFIIFSSTKNSNHFLRHLVPLSTPLPLSQFIVLIETVRQIIRPITLSVRLAANITAGHILIALCRNTIIILRSFSIILVILILLETAVAFIQRYVFTVLITMYMRET